ncbi:hypothetical protein ABW19_dt0203648 [Dactylella cylindrospora]|nr:hypothetical protein ABW19_dt0203648 [Dactylella cylindrospora]
MEKEKEKRKRTKSPIHNRKCQVGVTIPVLSAQVIWIDGVSQISTNALTKEVHRKVSSTYAFLDGRRLFFSRLSGPGWKGRRLVDGEILTGIYWIPEDTHRILASAPGMNAGKIVDAPAIPTGTGYPLSQATGPLSAQELLLAPQQTESSPQQGSNAIELGHGSPPEVAAELQLLGPDYIALGSMVADSPVSSLPESPRPISIHSFGGNEEIQEIKTGKAKPGEGEKEEKEKTEKAEKAEQSTTEKAEERTGYKEKLGVNEDKGKEEEEAEEANFLLVLSMTGGKQIEVNTTPKSRVGEFKNKIFNEIKVDGAPAHANQLTLRCDEVPGKLRWNDKLGWIFGQQTRGIIYVNLKANYLQDSTGRLLEGTNKWSSSFDKAWFSD